MSSLNPLTGPSGNYYDVNMSTSGNSNLSSTAASSLITETVVTSIAPSPLSGSPCSSSTTSLQGRVEPLPVDCVKARRVDLGIADPSSRPDVKAVTDLMPEKEHTFLDLFELNQIEERIAQADCNPNIFEGVDELEAISKELTNMGCFKRAVEVALLIPFSQGGKALRYISYHFEENDDMETAKAVAGLISHSNARKLTFMYLESRRDRRVKAQIESQSTIL
jgi:hypothetical protein